MKLISKVTEIYCIADDFCKEYELELNKKGGSLKPNWGYKRKRWEAELQLHNLADTHRYEVRTYMLTDIYTYSYRLRPREALLSLKWSF